MGRRKQPEEPVSGEGEDRDVAQPADQQRDGIQGEGNYGASRAFNDAERAFVQSGKGPARPAPPKSEEERRELIAAEEAAKRRAKK